MMTLFKQENWIKKKPENAEKEEKEKEILAIRCNISSNRIHNNYNFNYLSDADHYRLAEVSSIDKSKFANQIILQFTSTATDRYSKL